ncbi:response regulator transcription factor [Nocardioides daejeonensis]|uniref:response regulator transcription factor n=1 Tax=Nocardioides daejeonensis TaxID=1046556 RepID=UPI0013A5B0E4|nr:response regulator transcription factor [Nocardioides daejeonensis]
MISLLGQQAGIRVVWHGETFPQFRAWLERVPLASHPHLLVLDLQVDRGPSVNPVDLRPLIRAGLRVLVLSAMNSPEQVRAVLEAGVTGVVGKRDSENDIVGAMWAVLAYGRWLSPELDAVLAPQTARPELSEQEARALALYAAGGTLDEVAAGLGIRRGTAKKYISRVKTKYAAVGRPAHTKVELNRLARQDGFLRDNGSGPA